MVLRTGLTIFPLFLTVQILIRDCQVIRETKENQITELKKICEQSTESLNNDWEKKVSARSQPQDSVPERTCQHVQKALKASGEARYC